MSDANDSFCEGELPTPEFFDPHEPYSEITTGPDFIWSLNTYKYIVPDLSPPELPAFQLPKPDYLSYGFKAEKPTRRFPELRNILPENPFYSKKLGSSYGYGSEPDRLRPISTFNPGPDSADGERLLAALDRLSKLIGLQSGVLTPKSKEFEEDTYQYCKAVGDYLHDEGIPTLVLLDRAARPAHVGIRQYMRMRYPDEPLPSVYFIDPEAIETEPGEIAINDTLKRVLTDIVASENYRNRIAPSIIDDDLLLSSARFVRETKRTSPAAVKNFRSVHPFLAKSTSEPVLVFDVCYHTGQSMHMAKQLLIDSGFVDVRTGAIDASASLADHEGFGIDLALNKDKIKNSCYPFGEEVAICRKGEDIVATKSRNKYDIMQARQTRENLRSAVIRFASQDPDVPQPSSF